MSSKLLNPDDASRIQPMVWRQVERNEPLTPAEPDEGASEAQFSELHEECEQRVREAFAKGFREGDVAGSNRSAAEIRPILERLARTIEEIGQMRGRLRRLAEADMVQLSLAIARRVLRRELVADPDAVQGVVRAALDKLQGQEICRVKLHPAHAAAVKACLHQSGDRADIEILADGSREIGTLILETGNGNLDVSIESQLAEIERGLTDRLTRNP